MRPTWPQYFLELAATVSTRSTCPRAAVGTVIVDPYSHQILCTGYNGSICGEKHCSDVGCDLENDHCVRAVHSEANAIAQAASAGISIDGATAYVTHKPCWGCYKLLVNAGVTNIRYEQFYGTTYAESDRCTMMQRSRK